MRKAWIHLLCGALAMAQIPKGPVNIRIEEADFPNHNGIMLGISDDGGKASLVPADDGSGRQRWTFVPDPTGQWYSILIEGGVKNGLKYLSVNSDGGSVDLSKEDDGSGRQRWVLEPAPRSFFRIHILGGVQSNARYLTYERPRIVMDRGQNDLGLWLVVQAAAPQPPAAAPPIAPVPTNVKPVPVSPAEQSVPVRVSAADAEKLLISRPPAVPRGLAAQARLQGVVKLEFTVTADGDVKDVKILSGHPLLQGSAAESASHSKYKPYMVNGKPTEMRTTTDIMVRFTQ